MNLYFSAKYEHFKFCIFLSVQLTTKIEKNMKIVNNILCTQHISQSNIARKGIVSKYYKGNPIYVITSIP